MLHLVFTLPFILVLAALLWCALRRSPEQRTRSLFVKIEAHARAHPECSKHFSMSVPNLISAIDDCDIAYLKAFLRNLRRDYP